MAGSERKPAEGAGAPTPSSPAAAKRFDKWIVIGPGGGGAQFHPKVSPHDPKDILNSTDMSEAYVSHDGGESWRQFNVRGHTRFIVWDPVDPNTAYIKTLALFRTTDCAKTWELVHPDAANVERIAAIGDHGFERIVTKDGSDDSVIALAADPGDSKTLYAMMSSGGGYVMSSGRKIDFRVSTDWGKTWKKDASFPEGGAGTVPDEFGRLWVDPKSPASNRTIYVMGAGAITVREGGKWTTRKGPEGVKTFNEMSAGSDAQGKPVIYAASGPGWRGSGESVAGVFVSEDGARTWKKIDAGIVTLVPRGAEGVLFQTVATCATRPEVAYVSYKGPLVRPDRRERYAGVAKTTDSGRTWDLVRADSDKPGPNVHDAWVNERFGPEWGDNPFHIDVAEKDPDIAYATDFGRTMRTTDGGKTWVGVYSKRMSDGGWTTAGLDMTTCYGVHWDPFNPQRVFIDYTDIGLFASDDGGTSWKSATADGVPEPWVNTAYWMVFDPEVKGRCWAVMSGVHDLPFPKMWQRNGIAHYNGGVVVSDDSGHIWRKSNDGMKETAATDIIMDPASPKGARVLYVAGLGTGFWKSTDDGRTWTLKNNGIVGKEPFAWRIVMDAKGTLYGVVARRSWDGTYGNEYDGALYRSTDGAESWQRVTLPDRVTGPHGIFIDPRDTNRMYLAVWGLKNDNGDTDGGILLSTDGGKSWRWIFDKHKHVYDVISDPRNPDVLYAGTMTFSVWRSADRGETWNRVKGYNFKQVNRIIPDPFHEDMIYVSTFGGSIWYGPAKGDPDAVEDVTTPVMKY